MEIGDWWVAREIDVKAGRYLQEEQIKREDEREQRDREFWIAMFGGKQESSEITLEEVKSEVVFGTR
jgi:hypothetical protein